MINVGYDGEVFIMRYTSNGIRVHGEFHTEEEARDFIRRKNLEDDPRWQIMHGPIKFQVAPMVRVEIEN